MTTLRWGQMIGRLGDKIDTVQAEGEDFSLSRTIRPSKARLDQMVEEAIVDCYNESEQATGLYTMIENNLALPFETTVLGVPVTVERVDLTQPDDIVAVCRRARTTH